jgi:serine/threonine-protein kinase
VTVAFAHTRGVVHRDLKPSNIMVGPFGEVLVMDWGVAKILTRPALERPGMRMGTPEFMSPEQKEGDVAAVGPPSDVYALGALLFWLMTGQHHTASAATALRDHRPRLARRLRAIVMTCLAHSPADRYADAAGVAADLARYRAGEAVEALPETIFDRAMRLAARHLTLILLIVAYLAVRALILWWQKG